MDEDANLECASAENDGGRPLLDDEALPSVGGKTKIDCFFQIVATCMAMPNHDGQSVQQAAILGCRMDIHQLKQAEQQRSRVCINRPEQRQIVVAVPGGYRLAPLRQRVDSALLGQKGPDLMTSLASVSPSLAVSKTWPK